MFVLAYKQAQRTLLLSRPRSPENSTKGVFSRPDFNVQLLYLLLFFAVIVGVAFLTA